MDCRLLCLVSSKHLYDTHWEKDGGRTILWGNEICNLSIIGKQSSFACCLMIGPAGTKLKDFPT